MRCVALRCETTTTIIIIIIAAAVVVIVILQHTHTHTHCRPICSCLLGSPTRSSAPQPPPPQTQCDRVESGAVGRRRFRSACVSPDADSMIGCELHLRAKSAPLAKSLTRSPGSRLLSVRLRPTRCLWAPHASSAPLGAPAGGQVSGGGGGERNERERVAFCACRLVGWRSSRPSFRLRRRRRSRTAL